MAGATRQSFGFYDEMTLFSKRRRLLPKKLWGAAAPKSPVI
jgi:hypothetical protein